MAVASPSSYAARIRDDAAAFIQGFVQFGHRYRNDTADIVLYCSDNSRGMVVDDRRFSQIIDSHRQNEEGENTTLTIGPISSRLVGSRAHGRTLSFAPWTILARIAATYADKLSGRRFRLGHRVDLAAYRRIIEGSKCRSVVGVQPSAGLVAAAEECGVPIFDLQHGDISPDVPYYRDFATRVPYVRFLVWDVQTLEMLAGELGIAGDRIEVIGNPWITRYEKMRDVEGHPYAVERAAAMQRVRSFGHDRVCIVSLQWGLDGMYPQHFDNPYISNDLRTAIERSENVLWVLRPHPIMIDRADGSDRTGLGALDRSKVFVAEPAQWTLPTLLEICDTHITWHSSTVVDATIMRRPSLILCPTHYNYTYDDAASTVSEKPYYQYEGSGLVSWNNGDIDERVEQILSFVSK